MDDNLEEQRDAKIVAARNAVIEENVADVQPPSSDQQFESYELLKKRAALVTEESLNELQAKFENGLKVIVQALQEQNKSNNASFIKEWLSNNIDKLINISNADLENQTLDDLLQLPHEYYTDMFQAACYLDEKEQYQDALDALTICLILNSTRYQVWYVYGTVLQKNNQHEEAIYAFNLASILNEEEDPAIYAHIARSLIHFKLWDEALDFIQKSLELCSEDDQLKIYCLKLQQWIERRKEKA